MARVVGSGVVVWLCGEKKMRGRKPKWQKFANVTAPGRNALCQATRPLLEEKIGVAATTAFVINFSRLIYERTGWKGCKWTAQGAIYL